MLSTEVSSAICVQRFNDSRNSAIHTTYRISLRSSSMREPRYPLLRVVFCLWSRRPFGQTRFRFSLVVLFGLCGLDRGWPAAHSRPPSRGKEGRGGRPAGPPPADPWAERVFSSTRAVPGGGLTRGRVRLVRCVVVDRFNDPSAGSPTER